MIPKGSKTQKSRNGSNINNSNKGVYMSLYAYKEKLYLDQQPEIESVIRDYIDSLAPYYTDGYQIGKIEPIECRSRDGFSPYSHNCGGFDKAWITDLCTVWGSGQGIGNITTDEAYKAQDEAAETFIKHDASDETKAVLSTLPADKHNYHDLNELGHGDIAEELDEYCMEWLRGDYIHFGYRAMYEGKVHGWHTLMIYAGVNRSEYHGAHGTGSSTLAEIEIKFRNVGELSTKLEAARSELESAF